MPLFQCLFDRWEQAGKFHGQKQLREETLLGSLKYRKRRRLCISVKRITAIFIDDPRGFERSLEIFVNNRPSLGITIVDRYLLCGKFMLEKFIFNARKGQGAGEIKPLRFKIAHDQFHRRNTARADIA